VTRRRKLSSIRPGKTRPAGGPKPSASADGGMLRGSSSNASGFPGLRHDLIHHALVHRPRQRRPQQRPSVPGGQSRERQLGETDQHSTRCPLSCREDHAHGVGEQSARRDRQRMGRSVIEPLQVIDQA
jgi:hypothetical protein